MCARAFASVCDVYGWYCNICTNAPGHISCDVPTYGSWQYNKLHDTLLVYRLFPPLLGHNSGKPARNMKKKTIATMHVGFCSWIFLCGTLCRTLFITLCGYAAGFSCVQPQSLWQFLMITQKMAFYAVLWNNVTFNACWKSPPYRRFFLSLNYGTLILLEYSVSAQFTGAQLSALHKQNVESLNYTWR